MTAYVGYLVDAALESDGMPIAADLDYNQAFSKTLHRITCLCAGDVMALMSSGMAVEERDITGDDVDTIERLVKENFQKHSLGNPDLD